MSRPRKGEPGYEESNAKWRKTMEAKYGSTHEFMKRIGAKGGKLSTTGGFASGIVGADGLTGPERAKIAGSKGGKISKRGKAKAPRKDKGVKRGPRKEKGGWKWLFSRNEK